MTGPDPAALVGADLYRATHPAPATPRTLGRHIVEPGQRLVYRGLDETLWDLPVTVTGLCPIDYHCKIEFAPGWTLTQVDEHGLDGGGR